MSKLITFLLALFLASSIASAQQGSAGFTASESSEPFAAKPCFDYSTLQEPDAIWFGRLDAAKFDLAKAITLAVAEREDVRASGARLVVAEKPYFQIELMHRDSDTTEIVRFDTLSGEPIAGDFPGEPCFDYGDLSPKATRDALFNAVVTLDEAVIFSVHKFNHTSYSRQAIYKAQGKDRRHELEIFSSHKNGNRQRFFMIVPANKAGMRMRIKQPQFAGEDIKRGVPTTHESGLMTYDFIVGDGELVQPDSIIKAHYRLVLLDNQPIFNSKLGPKPVRFRVSEANLEGLKLGLQGMRVGGKRKIIMPAELAFGAGGRGKIPPGAIVVADIGIMAVESTDE